MTNIKVVPILLVLVAAFVSYTVATSSGLGVTLCDAYSPLYGCDPQFWEGGNRKACLNESQIMSWASKPERTDAYKLFAGDEANPATAYTPGSLISVSIRVMQWGMQYRGLLMYAVDSAGEKVGEWEIIPASPAWMHTPWDETDPCGKAILHAGAELKPLLYTAKFRGPEAGTGAVTFHALIKHGDANTGAFYWPNLSGDVTLAEGAAAEDQVFFRAGLGQSCTEYCEASSLYCDAEKIATLTSANVAEELGKHITCKLPYVGNCNDLGATTSSKGLCYFVDSEANCLARNKTADTPSCDAKSTSDYDGYRLCACTEVKPENSSRRLTFNLLGLISLLALCFNGKQKSFTILCLVALGLALLPSASAHNWVGTLSRSPVASTYSPCLPRISNKPHVQVTKDQVFQIEWVLGHPGRRTYIVVVPADQEEEMAAHNDKLLNKYIDAAPPGSNKAMDPEYQRIHRDRFEDVDGDYKATIDNTHAQFMERPPTGKRNYPYTMLYTDEQLANDVYVSYDNPEYPWIKAVYRFTHTFDKPIDADTAPFRLPSRLPYGKYIFQYVWGGYRDCVDVDYIDQAEPVEFVYGNRTGDDLWTRVDHCVFDNPLRNWRGAIEVVENDPTTCIKNCLKRNIDSCYGVGVYPLKAPDTVYPAFKSYSGVDWNDIYVNQTREQFENVTDPTFVCVDLQPRPTTQTVNSYRVTTDPSDPAFYSTCYLRTQNLDFIGYDDKPHEISIPWRFDDKCISCDNRAKIQASDFLVPDWEIIDTCVNCDREPIDPPAEDPLQDVEVRSNAVCDGYSYWRKSTTHRVNTNCTDCYKRLYPIGTTSTFVEQCGALARRDPECSNNYFVRDTNVRCFCYTKKACCYECSAVAQNGYTLYESKAPEADPTCKTGTLSFDKLSCCSGTCSMGSCAPVPHSLESVGQCCSSCISRSCNEYGPPCMVDPAIAATL